MELQDLNIINAKSGYKPTVQLFAGYNWVSYEFSTDLWIRIQWLECRRTNELEPL